MKDKGIFAFLKSLLPYGTGFMTLFHAKQQALTDAFNIFNTLRDPTRRSWILLNPTSLGDTMTVCALARAFKQKHGGPITMVVSEQQTPLAQMYPNDIDRIGVTNGGALHSFCIGIAERQVFCMDQPFVAHPFWYGDGRWESFLDLFRYPGRGGVSFVDMFRFTLRLDWESPLIPPTIPEEWRKEAETYAANAGIVPGKSVIFFPDNNSNPTFPPAFWEPLAEELVKNGWKVFTNLAGNRLGQRKEPFKNTQAITVPLHLAIPLAEIAGRYIAGNNGLISTFQIAKICSEGSILIYNKPYQFNGCMANDPLTIQSFRHMGFSDQFPNEYLVDPDNITPALISAIAANDPKHAVVW